MTFVHSGGDITEADLRAFCLQVQAQLTALSLGPTVLGPYSVTPATAGAMDPLDYGAELGDAIAAGKLVSFFVTGTAFNQPCTLSVGFGTSESAVYTLPEIDLAPDPAGAAEALGSYQYPTGSPSVLFSNHLLTLTPGKLVAALYPDSAHPTVGRADIYVRIESVVAP